MTRQSTRARAYLVKTFVGLGAGGADFLAGAEAEAVAEGGAGEAEVDACTAADTGAGEALILSLG